LLPPNAIATFFAEYFRATFFSSSPSGGFFRPFLYLIPKAGAHFSKPPMPFL